MTITDTVPTSPDAWLRTPDPHGQAALLLVESLIHGLYEKSVLTALDAVEIVERALSVQFDMAEEAGGAAAPMWRSHSLLSSIAASLTVDVDRAPIPADRIA